MFEVGGTACVVSVNGSQHAAAKAWDPQGARLCGVVECVECVGGEFVGLQLDRVDVLSSQRPAVKDEQEFVALLRMWCPVGDEQRPDRCLDAQLFADLAGSGLSGCLSGLHIPAGNVPVVLVGGLDEQDPVYIVEEQDASGNVGTAAIERASATARTLRACAETTCSRLANSAR